MKILLINPDNPPDAGRDLYAGDIYSALCRFKVDTKMYFGLPLALPTLAAVTPSRHVVRIIDEMIERIDFDEPCDLVGITAMTFKAKRAYGIAREFRRRGVRVVMGGIHASMYPEEAAEQFDSVVIGEAEEIWPKLLEDVEAGTLQARYKAVRAPDVSNIPPPRHDLTRHDNYFAFFLQSTRGCPYSCSFCTVTRMNGKKLRRKTPEQVVREVESLLPLRKIPFKVKDTFDKNKLKALGTSSIFFTDDNFAIDRKHALAVCQALTEFQEERGIVLNWFTQVNYEVGLDVELLHAMKAAGCQQLFMGFESIEPTALQSMNKKMNSPEKYAAAIRNVKQAGMEVVFSTIIGTDWDSQRAEEKLAQFIEKTGVFYVLPNILTPYPGTVLHREMEASGRIAINDTDAYNVRNVVFRPLRMTPSELQARYVAFCERVFNMKSMIGRAWESLNYPKRYKLAWRTRVVVAVLIAVSGIRLALQGRIRAGVLARLLLNVPRFVLGNGSLTAVGLLGIAVDYDAFARSEAKRLDSTPAARLTGALQARQESPTALDVVQA